MPKSDEDAVLALFQDAIALTRKIFLLVSEKSAKQIEKMTDLYEERGHLLDKIDSWRNAKSGVVWSEEFQRQWQKYADALAKEDKVILERFPDLQNKVQACLRDLQKRKYLLIYSKEPNL